ncbi:MAG: hypothetical protein HQL31_07695 [Planctomycetes bacterium]|nr:hypothetical protein [Planctomycetota bacterium]
MKNRYSLRLWCLLAISWVVLMGALPAAVESSLANEYFQEANRLMKLKDSKQNGAEIIYYLKNARELFLDRDLSRADEDLSVKISQALYWNSKMSPSNMKAFTPDPHKIAQIEERAKKGGSAPSEVEEAEEDTEAVAGEVIEKEKQDKPEPVAVREEEKPVIPEAVEKPEIAVAKVDSAPNPETPERGVSVASTPVRERPAALRQAENYRDKNPDDYDGQFLLWSQILEEVDDSEVITEVFDKLSQLRQVISDHRREIRWAFYQDITGLANAMEMLDYERAKNQMIRFYKEYGKAFTADEELGFKRLAREVGVLLRLKSLLTSYDYAQSIPADGIKPGFKGNLMSADNKGMGIIRSQDGYRQTLRWNEISAAVMASLAGKIVSTDSVEGWLLKAKAHQLAEEIPEAFDIYWNLLQEDSNNAEALEELRNCQLVYLQIRGPKIEEKIREVYASFAGGKTDAAARIMKDIRVHDLNHPLLSRYHYQLKLLQRKFKINLENI